MRNSAGIDVEVLGRIALIGKTANGDGRRPTVRAESDQLVILGDPAAQLHRHSVRGLPVRRGPRPDVAMFSGARADRIVTRASRRLHQLLLGHRRCNGDGSADGKQRGKDQAAHRNIPRDWLSRRLASLPPKGNRRFDERPATVGRESRAKGRRSSARQRRAVAWSSDARDVRCDDCSPEGRQGGSGELLLPGAPRTAGIPFCCPVGSDRALAL